MIVVDLSRQKELDADLSAVQLGFVSKFKQLDNNGNATDRVSDEYMFVLTILEIKVTQKQGQNFHKEV